MAWRVAESLETLRKQLNAAFPKRSKASDGGIGDLRHQKSKSSDHNPFVKDSKGVGVVRARDFTHDPKTGIDCQWLADELVKNKDPRIKYLIWRRQICSSKVQPWKWRPYSGVNAHNKHLHISVDADPSLYDSSKPWKLDFPDDEDDDIAKVSAAPANNPAEGIVSDAENELTQSAKNPLLEPPPSDQVPLSGQIQINQGDNASVAPPASFVPENKTIPAPEKDGATATTAKTTILGITVPAAVYAVFTGIQEWVEKGFIDVKAVAGAMIELIRNNVKYVSILVGLIVLVLVVKKVFKQITFLLQMYIAARPDLHNVTPVPAKVTATEKKWWQFWK